MTYGHWLQRAHEHLRAARNATRQDAALSRGDAAALEIARNRCYEGLARLVEFLDGGQPVSVDISRPDAELVMDGTRRPVAKLYLGLRVAARIEPHGPGAAADGVPREQVAKRAQLMVEAASATTRHLAMAADAVSTAGDVLASHIPPRLRPYTPEGAAIRAGAGVAAALADVGKLTLDLLFVDARLPTWVRHRPTRTRADRDAYRPVAEAARWATGSGLIMVANTLIVQADTQPNLLRLLDLAPYPSRPAALTDSIDAAARTFTACRDWMYRNPDQIRVAHLAAGTRLGLTITVLTGQDRPFPDGHTDAWRRAASLAAQMHGSPPIGQAAAIVDDLNDLTNWVREQHQLAPDAASRAGRTSAPGRLAVDLATLAGVLRDGAFKATERGELFVAEEPRLDRPVRGMVYASTTWRTARHDDTLVRQLRRTLLDASASTPTAPIDNLPYRTAPRIASQAFAASPGTSGQRQATTTKPERTPTVRRGRSR